MNRKATACLIIGIAVVAGCSVMTSFDGYTASDVSCDSLRWPNRSNDGSGGTRTLYGVTKQLRFAAPATAEFPGLDLDGLCTCPQAGSCVTPGGGSSACDEGTRGVDNKGGPLIGALFENDEALQESISHGVQGIVIRLDRYNGLANDADVIASIYNVVGVNEKTDWTGTAKFDGRDSIIVDSDSVISDGEMRSKYFDPQAYVANNVLVASIPMFRLRMMIPPSDKSPFEEVIEELRGVQLVGRVESEGENGLRIRNAVLTGRVPLQTMFLKAGPASICNPDAGSFSTIKGTVCASLDMTADPQADAGAGCDALSFALFLDIVPAQLRDGPKPPPPGKDPCAPTEIKCP